MQQGSGGCPLSASARPYIPSVVATAKTGQGPASSKMPVLELAVALAPQSPSGQLEQCRPDKARWLEETPMRRAQRRSMAPQDETPTKAARAAAQLRQLLDFYFEPFNLQHNRYLLDLLARRTPPPAKPGPWPSEQLADFRFAFDDLLGLGRISSALAKLKLTQSNSLGTLKHLQWSGDGRLQLRYPTEVRSFVAAKSASPEAVANAVRYLAAVREQRGQVPPCMLSVLSYMVGEPLLDCSVRGAHRQAQLKRQLLLHHADVMCLGGLDPEMSGAGLAATLAEEGYSYAWSRSQCGEANAIFWDRSRFELVGHCEYGASLAVDLCPLEDSAVRPKVVCMRPEVPTSACPGPEVLFAGRSPGSPLVACVDFTQLGGAESAAVVEELAPLTSLPREVLGDEVLAPMTVQNPDDGSPWPIREEASGLNRLHYPDSMLFEGLTPLLALSGHSELHLSTMASEDIVQQFPAFRLPIVAAFQWSPVQAMEDVESLPGPGQRIGSVG